MTTPAERIARARASQRKFSARLAAKRAAQAARRSKSRTNKIIRRRSGKAVTSGGNAIPKISTRETSKGTAVDIASRDEKIRQEALLKVQRDKQFEQEKELRGARRESARASAALKRRALSIQIEQRGVNVVREKARLKRETRQARATVLSRAAGAGGVGTSAFKASRIALRSGLQRKTGELQADEARNKLLDKIRGDEVEANLSARLAENKDPVNIFLSDSTNTKTTSSSSSFTGTSGSSISTQTAFTGQAGDTRFRINALGGTI